MLNLKPKTVTQLVVDQEQRQQEKKILTGKYMKGLNLYALDPGTLEVYQVQIETRTDFVLTTKQKHAQHKANINKKHLHLWALNIKNAERKFKNILLNNLKK